jgi:hypothetical protein
MITLYQLQMKVNDRIIKAKELILQIGRVPEGEGFWLSETADQLADVVVAELRHMAEHRETRTDTELRAMTEERGRSE